jgi:hypothetical protein
MANAEISRTGWVGVPVGWRVRRARASRCRRGRAGRGGDHTADSRPWLDSPGAARRPKFRTNGVDRNRIGPGCPCGECAANARSRCRWRQTLSARGAPVGSRHERDRRGLALTAWNGTTSGTRARTGPDGHGLRCARHGVHLDRATNIPIDAAKIEQPDGHRGRCNRTALS